jgi:predicted transcriptional regulator
MKECNVTQAALAKALGRTQQAVSAWVNERRRPESVRDREGLELLSKGRVHRSLWLNAEERKPVGPLRNPTTGTEG